MTLEIWITFALATSVLLLTPGPTVAVVVSHAISAGVSSARITVPAAVLGDFVAMTVSLAGAGAVLAASATLFTIMKLCGAAYLVWLGIRLWRREPAAPAVRGDHADSARRMFWSAFAVTALNPKSILFFVAFVPQFIDPASPLVAQIAVLELTFLALAGITLTGWAASAARIGSAFGMQRMQRVARRISGSLLVMAGVLTATARRAAG